ncbi:ATP-binding protein [Planomicrobium sp. CPCC 101079]|uniref:ATP-binding protein n=1 Tax=Planomicrobium sp. CPCC 101079 TaxID=2599618 RepID=UPI0011B53B59|nr:ATP-binding protein [Planomicrobium sp. CPCC 101079]TWT05917.1 AAA family ATPase [Planomicrobium sp. CPCC 101079]
MPLLKMLIGLPGSGKTTYARNLAATQQGWIHLSSDQISQNNYASSDNSDSQNVFAEMYQQTAAALEAGKNVIYDATNLASKRRRSLLNRLKNFQAETEAVVFLTPYTIAKTRNQKRSHPERVPDWVIERYIRSFQFPKLNENFNKVTVVFDPAFSKTTNGKLSATELRQTIQRSDISYQEVLGFYQAFEETKPLLEIEPAVQHSYKILTKQHNEPLEAKERELLSWVALLHGIGKAYVRKNLPFEEDNFYGYEHVSMYLAYPILLALHFQEEFIFNALLLIDEHVEAGYSKQGKIKRRLGLENYERLQVFLKAAL